MFGYIIILPIITNVQKISLRTGRWLPSNKTQMAKFALASSLKHIAMANSHSIIT